MVMHQDKELLQTPSQTVGPYFAYGLTPEQYLYDFKSLADNKMVDPSTRKNFITIEGKVYDGEGKVIPDAMIELWDVTHKLFGRFGTGTDHSNRFIFYTLKPLSINGAAPYMNVIVFMRGQLIHSYTRIYFSDEEELNAKDPVLHSISSDRRDTLIAHKNGFIYTFDIHMQGEKETVFFDI